MSHLNNSIFNSSPSSGEADKISTNIFGSNVITSQLNEPKEKAPIESKENKIDGKTTHLKEDDKPLLDSKTGVSFAVLAANADGERTAFGKIGKTTGKLYKYTSSNEIALYGRT